MFKQEQPPLRRGFFFISIMFKHHTSEEFFSAVMFKQIYLKQETTMQYKCVVFKRNALEHYSVVEISQVFKHDIK